MYVKHWKKALSSALVLFLSAGMLTGCAQTSTQSSGSGQENAAAVKETDPRYKLVLTEEPKPGGGSAPTEAAAAENAATDDPYKNNDP